VADLLEIPAFLRRESQPKQRRMRRVRRQDTVYNQGIPVKRPTKAQTKILVKREWTYAQIMKLTRAEAATIIKLKVDTEARFTKDKKHQFPDKKDDE